MASIKINPHILKGSVNIPASKSISHRAIIAAALCSCGHESMVKNLVLSKDIRATIDGMCALGAKIQLKEEKNTYTCHIDGALCSDDKNNNQLRESTVLECCESGSTLRFLIPIALAIGGDFKFTGKGKLVERPLDTYYRIFNQQGIEYKNNEGKLPLQVRGKLKCGTFEVEGNISSQFISGLLFALPLLKGRSVIKVNGNLESKDYVALTLDVLKAYGVSVENKEFKEFIIDGEQEYICKDNKGYVVEGDYSQAAFFMVAQNIGNQVSCEGLKEISIQGDRRIKDIVEKFASINSGDFIIDASQIPDLVPVLTVMASLKQGVKTEIINAGRLRIKESDRLKAIATEMNKLGAKVRELSEGLIIEGVSQLQGGVTVNSWNDHRIAMSLAVAATRCKEFIILEDYMCVEKSYPDFWRDYMLLGGDVHGFHVGE
ncbi:3-phosphoshikimate 1-carboxyvinyltransferase [Hathewaya proteolytica DSM 3090]|uniref:3-phosphoshikimate 1-carboxyvinyltransferase n=1 Tax=Hathewaya proteolytica DSM 3090 TaxID=1121331 RepID=A0A1M6QC74_9CLOT|nr:3-phosphoshikimate 1-carboxyvinyltransferase [Hathewaya proteolytica]SHK17766.1 3-phosphoshikimate 1-carboxyvinyltransferase [Hathewaya proteolytica DSM 3090]